MVRKIRYAFIVNYRCLCGVETTVTGGWVAGWLEKLKIRLSQLSTELKLKLKLSLAKTTTFLLQPDQNLGINKIPIAQTILFSAWLTKHDVFISWKIFLNAKKQPPVAPFWPYLVPFGPFGLVRTCAYMDLHQNFGVSFLLPHKRKFKISYRSELLLWRYFSWHKVLLGTNSSRWHIWKENPDIKLAKNLLKMAELTLIVTSILGHPVL